MSWTRDVEPHQARTLAESFGADALRYDRARPRYPEAMVQAIVAASPGRRVLDVGCGTGIAARQFQAVGCTVLGVEVDERMAEFARATGVAVEVAAFEAWDPAGRAFDAVIAGQTWHWIEPVGGAAKAAQALRPGGRLAVFWNGGQPPRDLTEAFATVYRREAPESLAARGWTRRVEDAYAGLAARAISGITETGAFAEPERWDFDWERAYSRDEWLDHLPTAGDHSQFPPAQLEAVLAGVGDAIDAVGGRFTMRYTTVVATAVAAGTR